MGSVTRWGASRYGSPAAPARRREVAGFTMIELMLVIGIIVMAAGLMAPTLADFFKNRELDAVSGQFGSVFSTARLQSVQRRRAISVVFFREGPRIYDEVNRQFTDDEVWNPESSLLARDPITMWFALGFARGVSSYDPGFDQPDYRPDSPQYVPPYRWWEERQKQRQQAASEDRRGGGAAARGFDVSNLYKVTFQRDGTLVFGKGGSDVATSFFQREQPTIADVVFLQLEGNAASFLDLRATGQFRSKVGLLDEFPSTLGDVSVILSAGSESSRRRR